MGTFIKSLGISMPTDNKILIRDIAYDRKIDYGLPRIMMACLYLIWREGNASSM